MKFLFKLTIAVLSLVLFTSFAHAQTPGSSSIDGVDIGMEPSTPNPGENVTINVESFVTDLNSASIVWFVDGKNYAQGTGLKSITIKAPAVGKNTNILAVIMTVEGREVKKVISTKSGGIDIIWESGGFVPPFYQGKASFAYENPIKIVAIPHLAENGASEIDPRTLVYKWTVNDKVVQDQSGYGKQSLILQDNLPKELNIKVEAGTRNGSQKATRYTTLTPGDPSVSFYEENPVYGVLYNKALSNKIALSNQEMTLRAVPFSFNTYKNKNLITYAWSINDLAQPDLSVNQSITLRTKGDSVGSSDISLEVRNLQDILQGAKNALTVSFSKKTKTEEPTF